MGCVKFWEVAFIDLYKANMPNCGLLPSPEPFDFFCGLFGWLDSEFSVYAIIDRIDPQLYLWINSVNNASFYLAGCQQQLFLAAR